MSATRLETLLARLYTDASVRARFLASPLGWALAQGLPPDEARAFAAMDPDELEMAALSYARKRSARAR